MWWLAALGWLKKLASNSTLVLGVVALVAFAMVLIAKNAEVRGLERQINDPKTGYEVRLVRARDAATTLRNNNAVLSAGLKDQNAAIAALGLKQDQSAKAWEAAQGELTNLHRSIAARIAGVDGAVAGPDKCASALQLLKGAAQ